MTASTILGFIASLVHLSGYVVYTKQMSEGTSKPNPATWILWTALGILNSTSYNAMTGDWVKGTPAIAGTIACIATVAITLRKGKMLRPRFSDAIPLVVGLVSMVVWIAYRKASYANVLLQFGFVMSMIPTYRGVLKNPANEKALPWFLWGTAYAITIAVIFLRWQDQVEDLVYPLNNLVTHGGIGILAWRGKMRAAPLRA